MKDFLRNLSAAALLLAGGGVCMAATSFSAMSVEEVSTLLSRSEGRTVSQAVSAKDTVGAVRVNVGDMVGKIFGLFDTEVSKGECVDRSRQQLNLTPEDDEGALWLESDGGYVIDYYGMRPNVSAMARFGDNQPESKLTDFGYFFLFPYTDATKRESVREQADFCGSLLQEMADLGLPMELYTDSDDLFEAIGDYNGSLVDIRLLDETKAGGGRYILILSVEPGALGEVAD